MRRDSRLGYPALILATFALVGACAGDNATELGTRPRTIRVEMHDTEFRPSALAVAAGESVRFVFVNKGSLPHDAFVGTEAQQQQYEAEMRDEPTGAGPSGIHTGASDYGVTVAPGRTAERVTIFDTRGEQIIGCHEPGHYAAGMKLVIKVR